MNKDLQKICGLLKHTDNLKRCGAAIVLAELAPREKAVVSALGEALNGAGDQLTTSILEALDTIASPDAVPYAMPLLASQNPATRLRAISILANGGPAIVPTIKEQMDKAPRQQRMVFVDLLARIHSRESMDILMDMICEPDFNLVKETCEAIRRHIGEATPQQLSRLHAQVAAFMNSPRARDSERITASSLLILGNIGLPQAANTLLKYASMKVSPYIRRNAMTGMKGINFSASASLSAWKKLAPFLNDEDTEMIRLTLNVMDRLPDSPALKACWKKLINSRAPAVRTLAARKLSSGDNAETIRLLVDLLNAEEPDLREMAGGALAARPKALPVLLKELTSAKDPEYAGRLARILKPASSSADKATIKKLTTMAAKDMAAGNPRCEAFLYFLRNTGTGAADKVVLDSGLELQKRKQWDRAVNCLRQLIHTPLFTDDVAYSLSICNLKTSQKELSPMVREKDYALRGLQSLLNRNRANLLERLQKDRSIDAADIFYVGFHFSEAMGSDRDFGVAVLQHLMKKWPKSAEAKSAKKKLGITAVKDNVRP